MDGILNIHKEQGFTSHDVVAKLRGILHQKKIGHTGTLDPDATGVLPVCVGRATKVCEMLTDKKKTYEAVVKLGVTTDTQDMSGNILTEHEVHVTQNLLDQTVKCFLGEIMQTPPMYSAIKVQGKRLYELARQGIEVERKQRKVNIYICDILNYNLDENEFTMRVECSKGTYIRTLCQDIGEKLGCGAAMKTLVRTAVDSFTIEDSLTLAEVENKVKDGTIEDAFFSIDSVFSSYQSVTVNEQGMHYLLNGNPVQNSFCVSEHSPVSNEIVRMYDEKKNFYALYSWDDRTKSFKNKKIFFNQPFE